MDGLLEEAPHERGSLLTLKVLEGGWSFTLELFESVTFLLLGSFKRQTIGCSIYNLYILQTTHSFLIPVNVVIVGILQFHIHILYKTIRFIK